MSRIHHTLIAGLCTLACSSSLLAETYYVYYLGGQSNMDGFGTVTELPEGLDAAVDGVYIFHGNQGIDGAPGIQIQAEGASPGGVGLWTLLQPGHGWGFTSDGETNTYGSRFGVELSFALRMREAHPARNIAIIKYSRGGTSISSESGSARGRSGCWASTDTNPPLTGKEHNQYDYFLATVRNAFADRDIDGDGEADTLIPAGIVWMQGESDSGTPEVAAAYEANLTHLMNLIRAALRDDDLPIVIGRISDSGKGRGEDGKVWTHGDIVREAQAMFCERDGHAALVRSTDEYDYTDPYHYDTQGFLDLGTTFAEALVTLEQDREKKPE